MASRPPEGAPSEDTAAYADAFAAAAADTSGTDIPAEPLAETPPAPAGEEPAAAPSEPSPAPDQPPAGAEPPVPAPAAPAPSADEIVKGLADLLKQQPAPAPAAEPAAVQEPEAPIYADDELGIITDYKKNWPDVAQAEELVRRAEYRDLLQYTFTEVSKHTAPLIKQVQTLQEQLRSVTNTLHVGELKAAVPDYSDSLESEVASWVDTQPAYLQAGMKQVMQQGTSEEVADLIGRYRAATGTAPAAPAATPAPAKPAQTELSSAAKQAAASLAPVSSDRSQVPQGQDPGDFASAFARYAAETMPK
jgi:hypothetical protein